jgi:predicted PurR-regulated permease PerM
MGVDLSDVVPPLASQPRRAARPAASDVQRAVALTLFFVLLVGCFVVLRPFLAAVIWAAILVVATWPLYRRVSHWTGERRALAALLMTLGLAALLLLPLIILGARLGREVVQLMVVIRALADTGLPSPPPWLVELPLGGRRLDELWRSYDVAGVRAAIEGNIGLIRDWVLARGADLGHGILQILLSLVTAFFLYRDADTVVALLRGGLANVTGPRAEGLVATAKATINGVVRGLLGTAVIQAILIAVGFAAAGVPAPMFLGFIGFFLSIVPAGLALLWLPAAAWLAMNGATGWAVFVAIWGAIVGSLDNFTRPYLMGQEAGLPFLLILLGVVGGAMSFGLVGLFLGPILLAIAASLVREWSAGKPRGR